MADERWIWKEWARQCTIAKAAILDEDWPKAEAAVTEMERLNAADPERPTDIPPVGLW